jgi:hypothetical protein
MQQVDLICHLLNGWMNTRKGLEFFDGIRFVAVILLAAGIDDKKGGEGK